MKSVIALPAPPAAKPKTYPYLGSYHRGVVNNFVVLFSSHKAGTVVQSKCPAHAVGKYYVVWAEELFVPFDGSVTLSND